LKKSAINSLTFNFFILTIGNFVGRILGYAREIIIVKIYGINEISDNLNLLLISPDFINNFFSWSIIISTVLPYIAITNSVELLNQIRNKILLIAGILYLIYIFIHFQYSHINIFPIVIITGTIFLNIYFSFTLVMAQKNDNFLFTSLANFLYNFGVIFALIFSGNNFILISVIIFIFSFFRFYLSKIYNSYKNYNLMIEPSYDTPVEKLNFKNILLAILSQTVLGLIFLIDKFYASKLQVGTLTIYSLIEKLYLAPVTIVIVSSLSARYPSFVDIISDLKNKHFEYYLFFKKNMYLSIILVIVLFFISPLIKYVFINFIGFSLNEINIIIYYYRILLFDLIPYSIILFYVNHLLAQKKFLVLLFLALFSMSSKFILLLLFANSLFNIVILNIINHFITLFLVAFLFYKYEKDLYCYLWRRSFRYDRADFKGIWK
jgi:putative peptidoglycan lipid II flippase